MTATATLPDGSTRRLISIADWDFRWQDVYRYAQAFVLPKGTAITMRYTYDNSSGNPRNPNHPPARVVWGQNTSDEMGDLWIQMVPRATADFVALNEDVQRKRRAEDLAAYTRLLEADRPIRCATTPWRRLSGGAPPDEAIVHFRRSLALNPESAPTHTTLATPSRFAAGATMR